VALQVSNDVASLYLALYKRTLNTVSFCYWMPGTQIIQVTPLKRTIFSFTRMH